MVNKSIIDFYSALPCTQSYLAILWTKSRYVGTQSPKYVRVKGLQTGPFKSSWLPNVNIYHFIVVYQIYETLIFDTK